MLFVFLVIVTVLHSAVRSLVVEGWFVVWKLIFILKTDSCCCFVFSCLFVWIDPSPSVTFIIKLIEIEQDAICSHLNLRFESRNDGSMWGWIYALALLNCWSSVCIKGRRKVRFIYSPAEVKHTGTYLVKGHEYKQDQCLRFRSAFWPHVLKKSNQVGNLFFTGYWFSQNNKTEVHLSLLLLSVWIVWWMCRCPSEGHMTEVWRLVKLGLTGNQQVQHHSSASWIAPETNVWSKRRETADLCPAEQWWHFICSDMRHLRWKYCAFHRKALKVSKAVVQTVKQTL